MISSNWHELVSASENANHKTSYLLLVCPWTQWFVLFYIRSARNTLTYIISEILSCSPASNSFIYGFFGIADTYRYHTNKYISELVYDLHTILTSSLFGLGFNLIQLFLSKVFLWKTYNFTSDVLKILYQHGRLCYTLYRIAFNNPCIKVLHFMSICNIIRVFHYENLALFKIAAGWSCSMFFYWWLYCRYSRLTFRIFNDKISI